MRITRMRLNEEKEHHLRDISFRDIRIERSDEGDSGISIKYCENVTFEDIILGNHSLQKSEK